MQPEISVIVPIYNVQKRLPICINSIIGQTENNIEIILIDDGSTDSCAEICDKFCEKDQRVKVIHKRNEGLPKARETGVSVSRGKYICFVDADDYVEKDYIEKLYTTIKSEKSDMVCCGCYIDFLTCALRNITVSVTERMCNVNSSQFIEILHVGRGRYHAMWNKLFRKECFENVIFPPRHTMFEDYFIMIQIIPSLNKITMIPECLYHYIQIGQGMSNAGFGETYKYAIYHMKASQEKILRIYEKSAPYIISFRLRLEMFGISTMTRNCNYDYTVATYVREDVRKHFNILWNNNKCSYVDKLGAICIILNLRFFWLSYRIYRKCSKLTSRLII